ncbi:MAG: repressor LexA [Chloroflexi bacterium]|nr:repressor LexA [Chloroflexota bacterium]
MERQELTPKQREMVEFIRRFLDERGYPPSVRDIRDECRMSSTSVVAYNLEILKNKGYLEKKGPGIPRVSRGIRLTAHSLSGGTLAVPVIGLIAAGQPIPVPDADTWDTTASAETIGVTADLTRGRKDVYALKVKGQSMIDALINDGDTVLMQYTNVVENGETAAVWLKDRKEATLKKVYYEPDRDSPAGGRGRIRLQPANTQMEPILVRPEDVEIQGKVIAVIRQLA